MKDKLKDLLSELRGFKFVATLAIEFKKQKVIMQQDIVPLGLAQRQRQLLKKVILMVFESIHIKIISNIQQLLGTASSWVTDSVFNHTINIWKYNPLDGSSYITLPKELDHPKNGLINIQVTGNNECLKGFFGQTLTSCKSYSKKNKKG